MGGLNLVVPEVTVSIYFQKVVFSLLLYNYIN